MNLNKFGREFGWQAGRGTLLGGATVQSLKYHWIDHKSKN